METPRDLETRFPYMFQGKHLGIGICKGWFPIFSMLCQDIDFLLGEDKQGFHWVQVKEKFGTARFYWELDAIEAPLRIDMLTPDGPQSFAVDISGKDLPQSNTNLVEQLSKLEMTAESATARVCAACGEPGARHSNEYFLTLCSPHAAQYEGPPRQSLDMWFDAVDDFTTNGSWRSNPST
jgi:hypothetical protein